VKSLKLCLFSVLIFFSLLNLADACVPPHPSYRLHLTVKHDNSFVSGASVFVFNSNKGIESIPIQHVYTDTYGQTEFVLGKEKYDILIVWSNTYTVKKNVSVSFAGEYLMIDITSTIPETTVLGKCYNWLPWTLGVLLISLIVGTFIIAFSLDTTWKKAFLSSILVNIPSVIIGVFLCLLL